MEGNYDFWWGFSFNFYCFKVGGIRRLELAMGSFPALAGLYILVCNFYRISRLYGSERQ